MDAQSLRPLISEQGIGRRVRELALELTRDYKGRSPLLLGVLKGAYLFLADLSRRMDEPPEVDFIQLSSYGLGGTVASPQVEVCLHPRSVLEGRHVVIVEDIVDSGRTLNFLRHYVSLRRPASLRVCALLVRDRARDPGDTVDYPGFTIGEGWLVGYGLDCAEKYRTLPDIHVLEEEP